MLYKMSSVELAINLIPVFVLFLMGSYLAYRIINQRKNHANATGIALASTLLIFFSLGIFFIYFPLVSYSLKIQENPNFFYKNTSLVLSIGVLLITFLATYVCKLREKNNTTILLYGINPNIKDSLIKEAVQNLGWKDYEITKQYHRGGKYGRNMLGRGGLSQEINESLLRGTKSGDSMGSFRSIEETVIETASKKIFIRGNRNLNIKVVNNDLKLNHIEGFELDEIKLAFRNVYKETHPFITQGLAVFWLFLVSAVGILFLILNRGLLSEELFSSLGIYIPMVFGLGTAFLYYDSDKLPTTKVRR